VRRVIKLDQCLCLMRQGDSKVQIPLNSYLMICQTLLKGGRQQLIPMTRRPHHLSPAAETTLTAVLVGNVRLHPDPVLTSRPIPVTKASAAWRLAISAHNPRCHHMPSRQDRARGSLHIRTARVRRAPLLTVRQLEEIGPFAVVIKDRAVCGKYSQLSQ
jgi:hypothetical protein